MSFIEIKHLGKVFGVRQPVVAVVDLSLDVQQGEFITLLGPSGCGKTTTLRCMAGLERPSTGSIAIGGESVVSVAGGVFVPPEKRGLGMVFQSYALWPHMTVRQNVSYPLEVRGVSARQIYPMVQRALATVDLDGYGDRYPTQLSGGQQQRVALARAIVGEPRVLLFDEPLSNLDAKLRERMRLELVDLVRRVGCTAVYVTHDQTEAMVVSDRIVVMNSGRIQQIGTPREVYESPASQFVADFIGTANFVPGHLQLPLCSGPVRALTSLGEVHAFATVEPGAAEVLLSIRPESIEIASDCPRYGYNAWPGRVEKAVYLGERYEYVIRVNDMAFHARTGLITTFSQGSHVWVHFPADRCVVISSLSAAQTPSGGLSQ